MFVGAQTKEMSHRKQTHACIIFSERGRPHISLFIPTFKHPHDHQISQTGTFRGVDSNETNQAGANDFYHVSFT